MTPLRTFIAIAVLAVGCSDDPPPPSANPKLACDTLAACGLSSSGFSCDNDKLTGCAQCINATSCEALRSGTCGASCPGVEFKPK